MMIKASILTLFSFFVLGVAEQRDHAIYLSMIEITHQEGDTSGELSIKVFVDDFEDALKNEFGTSVKFSESNPCTPQNALIVKYFQKHISVVVDQLLISSSLSKCEMMGDAIWFRFTFETAWIKCAVFCQMMSIASKFVVGILKISPFSNIH